MYRDFNLDLESTSTLNAKHSRKMMVRAPGDMEWSVTHKPDWVTVTPSSGTGKVEVTILFDEMVRGNGNRADSLVFKPTAYDYHKSVKVDQYDYPYDSGDVIINQTATVGNGVNIVFMGDCFDAKDIAEGYYEEIMNEAIGHFFAIEPYNTYRDYFNVYSVFGMSADSGMGTANTIREARFGSQYSLTEGVMPDFETIFAGACKAPIDDNVATTLIILVENTNECNGFCALWEDGSAVAIATMSTDPAPRDFRGVIHHEAGGHGFGKLADEYIYHNGFVSFCKICDKDLRPEINEMKSYGFYTNISLSGNMHDVPWSHFIYDPQYSNVVDVYEGAYMHTRGVWRSEATSCMNNNIPYYNAISRESMVKRIMKYADEEYSFEAFKALDHESLPSILSTRTWDGVSSTSGSSQFEQRPPKFMGEKPKFDKKKF